MLDLNTAWTEHPAVTMVGHVTGSVSPEWWGTKVNTHLWSLDSLVVPGLHRPLTELHRSDCLRVK